MDTVQATAICKDNQAILLMGKSGSGKSLLALDLIESGWTLISDDMTVLTLDQGQVLASPPDKMQGCIEARTLGIVTHVPYQTHVPILAVIILDSLQPERMPTEQKFLEIKGVSVPVFFVWQEEKYVSTLIQVAVKIAQKNLILLQNNSESA